MNLIKLFILIVKKIKFFKTFKERFSNLYYSEIFCFQILSCNVCYTNVYRSKIVY